MRVCFLAASLALVAFFFGAEAAAPWPPWVEGEWRTHAKRTRDNNSWETQEGVPMPLRLAVALPAVATRDARYTEKCVV